MLDILFMGTAQFAVPSLEALVQAGHRVRAVVTQPDRPRGRGGRLTLGPVKAAAREFGLAVLQPEKAADPPFIASVRDLRLGLVVVVAYGQILRPALLEVPPLGCVNVHASLLPELRGAAPVQWAILRGYRETGVTTMFMDKGMDTGDIILQRSLCIEPGETAGRLAERLAILGAGLLLETASLIEAGSAPRTPQDAAGATYAPMLAKQDGLIDWSRSAGVICNQIHGCNPTPGAFTYRDGSPLKLWRARPVEGVAAGGASPGDVVRADGAGLVIAGSSGGVAVLEIQPESRARMGGAEFVRGYRVRSGERWGTLPQEAASA